MIVALCDSTIRGTLPYRAQSSRALQPAHHPRVRYEETQRPGETTQAPWWDAALLLPRRGVSRQSFAILRGLALSHTRWIGSSADADQAAARLSALFTPDDNAQRTRDAIAFSWYGSLLGGAGYLA
jgi:hypothetical protein